MKKTISLLLSFLLVVSVFPAYAFAAPTAEDILTAGGVITLQEDLVITDDIELTKDTILNLNGHTITGTPYDKELPVGNGTTRHEICFTNISIAQGTTVSIYNGSFQNASIENNGTIEKIINITINIKKLAENTVSSSTNKGCAICNNGLIKYLGYCTIRYDSTGIYDYGDIDIIDNCDIEAYSSAISNTMFVSKIDEDQRSTISEIRHCRLIATDSFRGCGFGGAEPVNGETTIVDSVLIGYGRGGIENYGCQQMNVNNCVLINANSGNGAVAVRTVVGAIPDIVFIPPHCVNSIFISTGYACGYWTYDENDKHIFVDVSDMENCIFIPLSGSNWKSYDTWVMDPLPEIEIPATDPVRELPVISDPIVFSDVPAKAWYSGAIDWASSRGITAGKTDGSFGVNDTLTTASMMQFIYNSTVHEAEEAQDGDRWYSAAARWGVANGYLASDEGITEKCTRLMVVKMLYQAAGSPAVTGESPFTDSSDPAVIWAYENEITAGNGKGEFLPDTELKRSTAITFIKNAFSS